MPSEGNTPVDWMAGREFSSPNNVPWRLCAMLQRLAAASSRDHSQIEQNGLVAVFIGMTVIEAFTNIYGRIVADEAEFAAGQPEIMRMLGSTRCPTGVKLLTLGRVFGHPLDERDERWREFHRLREMRNEFVHFRSIHQTLNLPGFSLAGTVETTQFAALSHETPHWAFECVRGVIAMVGEARGIPASQLRGFVHGWTGVV